MSVLRFLRSSLLGSLLLSGCIESTPVCGADCDDGVGTTQFESNTRSDGGDTQGDGGEQSPACGSLQERVRALLAAHQRCEVDADCTTAYVEGRCLDDFLCPPAVALNADLEALRQGAAALTAEYEVCMNTTRRSCAIARCGGPELVRIACDETTKLCTKVPKSRWEPIPERDAGGPSSGGPDGGSAIDAAAAPDAARTSDGSTKQENDASARDGDAAQASDGSTGDAASAADAASVDPRFSCESASDCAVKNVGNCCGYYPRCANVDAEFGPPDCSDGRGSVCGWPEIERCDCRANRCVALQGAREI